MKSFVNSKVLWRDEGLDQKWLSHCNQGHMSPGPPEEKAGRQHPRWRPVPSLALQIVSLSRTIRLGSSTVLQLWPPTVAHTMK